MSDARPRVYLASARALTAGQQALRAVFDGVWLGLLTPDHLQQIDDVYYRRDRMYVVDDYNRSGLLDWERGFVDEHLPPGGRVAVTGAGGGREVRALCELGFEVAGFECNDLLARAGNRLLADDGLDATITVSERDRWTSGTGAYDGLVVGWGAYTLMSDRRARIEFLRRAGRDLGAGTPVLLSFFVASRHGRRLRVTEAVGSALRRVRGRPPLERGDALAPNFVHWFTQDQVASEVEEAGYEMVSFSPVGYGHAVARRR